MKYFRAAVYGIFLCSCILLIWILVYEKVLKKEEVEEVNLPVITSSVEVLEMKIEEGEDTGKLLEGLSARDEEDGDLSEEITISNVSDFREPGVFTVSYEVSDSDGNAVSFSRDVQYTDYSSPQFKIRKEPVCYVGDDPKITDLVAVTDKIDGNLTKSMTIDSSKLNTDEPGLYPVTLEVTNSMNDTVSYRMFICVKEKTENQTAVKLSRYSVTIKKNSKLDPEDYIDSVLNEEGEEMVDPEVEITNEATTENAGVFPVIYRLKDYYADTTAVLMVEVR